MKSPKTFAKILYYLFTILVGILMCVFLPYFFLYDGESLNMIEDALESGDPAGAMAFVGGYYKSEPIFAKDFENGGSIVLFESATLYTHKYEAEKDEEPQTKLRLHKSYYGFVYGVEDIFDASKEQDNKTILKISTADGEVDFPLLDSDSNKDGVMDYISTLRKNGFFVLELGEDDLAEIGVTSMSTLKILDKDGNVFAEMTLPDEEFGEGKLFGDEFFSDVEPAILKYNQMIDFEMASPNDENFDTKMQSFAKELNDYDEQILAKGYKKSSISIAKTRADKIATIVIVVYFVAILVIGDFLVGPRWILKFFKWFLVKVCKVDPEKLTIKRKEKIKQHDDVDFGGDYYCQVKFELDPEQKGSIDDQIIVAYASEKQNVVFDLNKGNEYSEIQRIQKDVLKLTSVESSNGIAYNEIPDLLNVEGFNKSIIIKTTMMQEE